MITFHHHSIDKPKNKIVRNVVVNDQWKIDFCQLSSSSLLKRTFVKKINTRPNESAIAYYFTMNLIHNNDPKRRINLYAATVMFVNNQTKNITHQSIRYFTMYNQKTYDYVAPNILFLDHLKKSLDNKELNPLFPYKFVK